MPNAPAGVKIPHGFAISPDGGWLVAASQDSNSLASHKIDPATGKLTPAGKADSVGAPVCVVFAAPRSSPRSREGRPGRPSFLAHRREAAALALSATSAAG